METTPPILFDRARLRKRRARAAASFLQHDFLWHEAAERTQETLSYINRDFPRVLAFGGHGLTLPTSTITHAALAPMGIAPQVIADEEWLPFADDSFDAVISLLTLQWVNDIPGALAQIRRVLKPDGLFFAILPEAKLCANYAACLPASRQRAAGGISPRVAPFMDVRDGGALFATRRLRPARFGQ